MAEHLRTFEAEWTDEADGRTLPGFVLAELNGYLGCGLAARGFGQLQCEGYGQRHLVSFSCRGRGFCPSCLGRRMNEGAENLTEHVHPAAPVKQWVLTLPHVLRFPLAFEGRLLAAVLRMFIDTVAWWYRRRQAARGLSGGLCRAVAVPFGRVEAVALIAPGGQGV